MKTVIQRWMSSSLAVAFVVMVGLSAGSEARAQEWKKLLSCENGKLVLDVDESGKTFQLVLRNSDAIRYFGFGSNEKGEFIAQRGTGHLDEYTNNKIENVTSLFEGNGRILGVVRFGSAVVHLSLQRNSDSATGGASVRATGYSLGEAAGPDRTWLFSNCSGFSIRNVRANNCEIWIDKLAADESYGGDPRANLLMQVDPSKLDGPVKTVAFYSRELREFAALPQVVALKVRALPKGREGYPSSRISTFVAATNCFSCCGVIVLNFRTKWI